MIKIKYQSYLQMIFFMVLLFNSVVKSQKMGNPIGDYTNVVGAGVSLGAKLNGSAWLWGFSSNYAKILSESWTIDFSIAFDQEKEKQSNGHKITDAFSLTVAIGYIVNEQLVIGTGFGHGFINNELPGKEWKWIKFGDDLATGIYGSYSIWQTERYSISPTITLEYSISDNIFSISTDVGLSYSF